jgi:hypothetical protein
VAVFFGAAAAGFFLTPRIASDSLRVEAEERLSRVAGVPVRIGDVRLALASRSTAFERASDPCR